MTAFTVAKGIARIVSVIGVGKVVKDVVENNTTIVTQKDAVKVAAGGLVIGAVLVDATVRHVNNRFDEAEEWYQKWKQKKSEEPEAPPVVEPPE